MVEYATYDVGIWVCIWYMDMWVHVAFDYIRDMATCSPSNGQQQMAPEESFVRYTNIDSTQSDYPTLEELVGLTPQMFLRALFNLKGGNERDLLHVSSK